MDQDVYTSLQDDKVIRVEQAGENNLRDIDVTIPRNQLIVVTGVSGSGKSSLAFDTLHAEGQRRYVESLSSYARQFLGQLEKPHVDHIEGLSPAISIDQKAPSRNPRSTVGTVTEIHDYLRVLYARLGVQHCHQCGRKVGRQSPQQMAKRLDELDAGAHGVPNQPHALSEHLSFGSAGCRVTEALHGRVLGGGQGPGLLRHPSIMASSERRCYEGILRAPCLRLA